MSYTPEQHAGAEWLLTKAMAIPSHQDVRVLVVCDEYSGSAAECVRQTGEGLGIPVATYSVPRSEQVKFAGEPCPKLPLKLLRAIDKVTRLVVMQVREQETNEFRKRVLAYAEKHPHRRTASMPGLALQHLPLCGGDLDEIEGRCRLVADRLLWANSALLVTGRRSEAVLNISINGAVPLHSSGRVPHGHWCNVPSGETFILPSTANGQVCIDGSILGYPIPDGEELCLTIRDGQIVPPCTGCGGVVNAAMPLLFPDNRTEAYPGCSKLAELGIGLNDRITGFTGLPLFDEKVLGTVHLGFGSNTQFKGPLVCKVHNDFVIRNCTLTLDGDSVIHGGTFRLAPEGVYRNWRDITIVRYDPALPLRRIGDADVQPKAVRPLAVRRWSSDRMPGATATQIGDDETASLAAHVIERMPKSPSSVSANALASEVADSVPRDALPHILEILIRYGLLRQ